MDDILSFKVLMFHVVHPKVCIWDLDHVWGGLDGLEMIRDALVRLLIGILFNIPFWRNRGYFGNLEF